MSDYISRDAVLAYPIRLNHYDRENGNVHFVYGIENVMEYVESLPAADVAPVRHGRWVVEAKNPDFDEAKCTACNGLLLVNWKCELSYFKYCPNCGADMRGDSDE